MLITCLHQWHTVGMSQFIITEVLNVGLVHVIYVLKLVLWMDLPQGIVLMVLPLFQTGIAIIGDILTFIIQIVIAIIIFVVGIGNM